MGVAYDIIFSVIAGLPEVYLSFFICYMVYFNKIKSNLGGLSCTRGSPQPKDYMSLSTQRAIKGPQPKLPPPASAASIVKKLGHDLRGRQSLYCNSVGLMLPSQCSTVVPILLLGLPALPMENGKIGGIRTPKRKIRCFINYVKISVFSQAYYDIVFNGGGGAT